MQVMRCDSCKKTAYSGSFARPAGWTSISHTGNPHFIAVDLCPDCAKKFLSIAKLERSFAEEKEKG